MTFSAIETSRDDGRPIELYQISYTSNQWFYTSADRVITYLGVDYEPVPIMRGNIQPVADVSKATLSITMSPDLPVANLYRVSPPSEPVIVTVLNAHYLDGNFTTVWKGRITSIELKSTGTTEEAELTVDNIFTSLRRTGPKRRCQLQCPFALYGDDCGIARDTWKEDTVLSGMSGLTLTVNSTIGKPDNWYAGGWVTWTNNVNNNTERRAVRSSNGTAGTISLGAIPLGLAITQSIRLYPGCDHTLEGVNGCFPKFNNAARFGGTPYMPPKNPFSSTIY